MIYFQSSKEKKNIYFQQLNDNINEGFGVKRCVFVPPHIQRLQSFYYID